MTAKKRPAAAPTLGTTLRRSATLLAAIDPADVDRAIILGQLAELLMAHPRIGSSVAYKGGAIMNLVDGSPRLSRDLDGAAVSGRPVRRGWVDEAFSTPAARKVVRSLPRIVNENPSSLVIPMLECQGLEHRGMVVVSLSINWKDPLLEPPVLATVELKTRRAQIPVLSACERAAEKARTFLTRGEPRDAYDLHRFGAYVLTKGEWQRLPKLIQRKLPGHVEADWDLLVRWDEQTSLVSGPYERGEGLVLLESKPAWTEVHRELRRFKGCVPRRLPIVSPSKTARREVARGRRG